MWGTNRLPEAESLEASKQKATMEHFIRSSPWDFTALPTEPIPQHEALELFNRRFVYIIDAREVLDMQNGHRMSVSDFMNEVHRNKFHLTGKGEVKKTALAWMDWADRNELSKYTFAPGEERVFEDSWNLWRGSGLQPRKGNIAPWTCLLDHLFQGLPDDDRVKFEQWLAYPIQHLGTKLHTAVLLCGGQGIGKTLLTDTIKMVYGKDNAITISNHELQDQYNSWAAHRQLVVCDEIVVHSRDRNVLADRLKGYITNHDIHINDKFVRKILLPNRMNLIFTSNSREALSIEEDDRRYFVVESVAPRIPEDLRQRFIQWRDCEMDITEVAIAEAEGERLVPGLSSLLYHLMTLNLIGFNPYDPAPSTAGKVALRENTSPSHVNWLRELKDNLESEPFGLVSAEELLQRYRKDDPDSKVSPGTFSKAMSELKFVKACNDGIRTKDRKKRRLWVLKSADKYRGFSPAEIGHAYDAERESKLSGWSGIDLSAAPV
jgi:hypothetical protein